MQISQLLIVTLKKPHLRAYWLCALYLTLSTFAFAQTSDTRDADQGEAISTALHVDSAAPVSIEVARSRLQAIEASTTLDDAQRTRAADIYRQIVTDLEATKSLESQRAKFSDQAGSAPAELERTTARLEQQEEPISVPKTDDWSQVKLDDAVRQRRLQQDDAQKQLEALQRDTARRADRRIELADAIASVNEARQTLQSQPLAADASSEVREALSLARDVKLYNNQLETLVLQAEQAFLEATAPLLPKQIELAQRQLDRTTEEVRLWTAAAEAKRQQVAQQDKEEKETKARIVPDELKSLADQNLELSRKLEKLVASIASVTTRIESTQEELKEWTDQFDRVKQLIESQSGVTESVGGLLREQRAQLPNLLQLRSVNAQLRRQLYEVRSERFTNTEQLLQLSPLDRSVERETRILASTMSSSRLEELRTEIRTLLEAREKTLNELNSSYSTLLAKANDLSVKEEMLMRLVERYTTFIDQRVLWIRSVPPLRWSDISQLPRVLQSVATGAEWRRLFYEVIESFKQLLLLHFSLSLMFVLAIVYRQSIIRRVQEFGEQANSRSCRNINPTIKVVLWTFVLSALGPAVLVWVGAICGAVSSGSESELASALSLAARQSALVYWPISFWLHVVRRGGLAESHFDWQDHILRLTRRQFALCIPTLMPAAALFYFFQSSANPQWQESLARLALMFASLVIAHVIRRLLAPSQGIPHEFLARNRDGWLYRLRYFWYGLLIATPLIIMTLCFAGFLYTAQRLSECLYTSVVYVSGIYFVWSIAMRWSLLNRRAIAIAQARERLAANAAEKARSEGAITAAIAEQINLVKVNEQTNRLLTSFAFTAAMFGIYLIWISVLPALERLNDIQLWRVSETLTTVAAAPATAGPSALAADSSRSADTSAVGASGSPTTLATDQWITLGNVISSLLILVLAWIAVRNIPGLLEIAILQHLPLDASIRFLVTTITRYVLIVAGMAVALSTIGFGWSKIQWLAAGVSVGLGFGLQEIFANFISGLILLFERPLRAGDVITVGDVTGTVVNIKTRATTILDWDHKELIVPNKEFITGRLLNWTLSNTINRLVIKVGVAYGSDVDVVRSLLLQLAHEHPAVLDTPPSTVTFDQFGDSALHFSLRCFLGDLEHRLATIHELHQQIYESLNAAGISIPFPQRDVHVIHEQ